MPYGGPRAPRPRAYGGPGPVRPRPGSAAGPHLDGADVAGRALRPGHAPLIGSRWPGCRGWPGCAPGGSGTARTAPAATGSARVRCRWMAG